VTGVQAIVSDHTPSAEAIVSDPSRSAEAIRLLAIAEDLRLSRDLARYAELEGVVLEQVTEDAQLIAALARGPWSALLLALGEAPEEKLTWWIELLRRSYRRLRIVPVTPAASIGLAIHASRLGAFDVLTVPVGRERFTALLSRLRLAASERVLPLLEARPVTIGSIQMVSESPTMIAVYRAIAQAAPSAATVLIIGDSGTGKELVARAVHLQGPRAAAPFVAVNCAAIPENLLESELFGHEKGAFTGAIARKIGRFERAHGGTLFLDEIGDMSLPLQSKILRAIQEREIERVGGSEPIPVNVRLLAATNRDLKAMIGSRQFREDLYYRLAVLTIKLPRLSDRGDDLLVLTTSFLREFGRVYGKSFGGITDRAIQLLRSHDWVGNVRELRNVIERAVLVAEGEVLRASDLPEEWQTEAPSAAPLIGALGTLAEMECRHIQQVLEHTGGQIVEAARILGVHRNTLTRKIREYRL